MPDFVQSLAIETWTLWSIGIILIGCRMISRRIKFRSWLQLQIEDWLMAVVTVTFTLVMYFLNEVAKNGSNFLDYETAISLKGEEAERAIYGSKMALAMEMCTLATIWMVKICLLILYHRLTMAYETQHLIVKIIGTFCLISYFLVVGLLLGHWCQPIEQYWALPVENSECATYYKHMIFATAFNISSDLMLLAIPIPIVIQSQLPLKRKLILCGVLGLGAFNILMAILNRYYNFSNPNELVYTYWYVAEVATAVYVGNLPLCWQFISHVFKTGSWASFKGEPGQDPNSHVLAVPGTPAAARRPQPKRKKTRNLHSVLPHSLFSTHNATRLSTSCDDEEADLWGTTAANTITRVGSGTHAGTEASSTITKTQEVTVFSTEASGADDIELQLSPSHFQSQSQFTNSPVTGAPQRPPPVASHGGGDDRRVTPSLGQAHDRQLPGTDLLRPPGSGSPC
ncbi:hypothetical protein V8F20_008068 [Naviculisporaceae sp. PSN 640]